MPTNPVSSPIMAKIESVEIFGKKRYFWSELANPFPKIPPDDNDKII
jgi:hypothetical protein